MLNNRETEICRAYAEAVFRRGSYVGDNPLIPSDHVVDWDDQPSRFKIYRNVPRLPLDDSSLADLGSLEDIVGEAGLNQARTNKLTYEKLSKLLLLANGILQRRLDINWNLDNAEKTSHLTPVYGRLSASGGGMYPFEFYLIKGEGGRPAPGIYHYDNAHHALAQLAAGDASGQVRAAAFNHAAARDASDFFLVSLNFWKNSFKYHNFCYHVVTQDLGAALATIRLAALALGIHVTFLFWFQDEVVNRILGLETLTESVFAIMAVSGRAEEHPARGSKSSLSESDLFTVRESSYQRSKQVIRLPLVERVHQSTLVETETLPTETGALKELIPPGEAVRLPLPGKGLMKKRLLDVVLSRNSSWGKMVGRPELEVENLAAILRTTAGLHLYKSDLRPEESSARFTRLMLFANHVEGTPAGLYSYDPAQDCLLFIRAGSFGQELQRSYLLKNYNLEQAAVLFVITGNLNRMLDVYGNRGFRILNAEAGLVAQNIHLASAALSLGCGTLLGFDNVAINTLAGLDGSGQTSLLLVLAGHERNEQGRYIYQMVRG